MSPDVEVIARVHGHGFQIILSTAAELLDPAPITCEEARTSRCALRDERVMNREIERVECGMNKVMRKKLKSNSPVYNIFEAKRLYKLSKDKVNVAYKIPSNQWLKALK